MLENEENPPSIDEIINSWKQKYGEETLSRGEVHKPYWRIDLKDYHVVLNILLKTLVRYGYKKEDAEDISTLNKIKKALTPDTYDKDSLDKWKQLIEGVWQHYVDKEFVNNNIEFAEYKEYPKQSPEKLEKVEELPLVAKELPNFEGFGELKPLYDEEFLALIKEARKEK